MKALDLKLLRELRQLRMQMLSIALVVAAGVMSVVTMRGSYQALYTARENYYQQAAFAEVWSSLVRAPEAVAERIAAIPGVQQVATRVTLLATLDLPGLTMPAQGRFVSVPEHGRPLLNDIRLLRGRYIAPGGRDEVVVNEKFALARAIDPGAEVSAIINGRARTLRVVGIASSPEFTYAVPPGSIMPEYERFGVFWMSRESLGPAYNMDSAFNEVVLTLAADANPRPVLQQLDALLEPYGGLGAYAREDQLSHLVLSNELEEIRLMGTVIPAIFLAVAVFLLHQVMNRLIATQRSEIAVLKAFGYSNAQTGLHFLMFAVVAVLIGTVIGGAGGAYLGRGLVGLYGEYFELPGLEYRLTPSLLLLSATLIFLGAGSGALGAVYRAARLPPAEAMRPQAPPVYRAGLLERSGLARTLPPALKFMLRNISRRPLQFALSVGGVACALAILVVGMYFFDAMNFLMDTQFRKIQREDLSLSFREELGEGVRYELQALPGVRLVETYRQAPARLRNGHLEEEIAVTGIDGGSRLRRVVNSSAEAVPLPASGIVLGQALADKLRVREGDQLQVEWLDGKRRRDSVLVSGTTDDYLGLSAWMTKDALARSSGDHALASGAWLLTDGDDRAALFARLKALPAVAGVSSPPALLRSFREEMARGMLTSASFLLGFAGIIAFGVIYNSARIALSERARELASLRVMGFYRRETVGMLLGEQLGVTLLALPPGCLLGYLMAMGIRRALENDTYRIPLVLEPGSYFIASLLIVAAALFSMLAVRRRVNNLDLISVLKTRE